MKATFDGIGKQKAHQPECRAVGRTPVVGRAIRRHQSQSPLTIDTLDSWLSFGRILRNRVIHEFLEHSPWQWGMHNRGDLAPNEFGLCSDFSQTVPQPGNSLLIGLALFWNDRLD